MHTSTAAVLLGECGRPWARVGTCRVDAAVGVPAEEGRAGAAAWLYCEAGVCWVSDDAAGNSGTEACAAAWLGCEGGVCWVRDDAAGDSGMEACAAAWLGCEGGEGGRQLSTADRGAQARSTRKTEGPGDEEVAL